jgi:S-layer protein (TIGR01564 family)
MSAQVTKIQKGDDVTGETVIIQKIDVGATKLASEVAGLEKGQNLLLVGGPCANRAVEAASSEFPTCSGWSLAPGEALIQVVNQADGHVALLVAGTTAADTRAATALVAKQDKLKALANGVTRQVLTVSTGTLMDLTEPEAMEDTTETTE